MLRDQSDLNSLGTRYNQISDIGVHDLAQALLTNQTLTHLDLFWNQIGHEGVHDLAQMLWTNQTLTHLNSDNHIGAEGAHDLAQALLTNQTLTHYQIDPGLMGDVIPTVNRHRQMIQQQRETAFRETLQDPTNRLSQWIDGYVIEEILSEVSDPIIKGGVAPPSPLVVRLCQGATPLSPTF